MGKVEKIVTLSVVFLVCAIVVVALVPERNVEASKMEELAARSAVEPAPSDAPRSTPTLITEVTPETPGVQSEGSGVQPEAPAAQPQPPAAQPGTPAPDGPKPQPAGSAPTAVPSPTVVRLLTQAGLEDSYSPDLKYYAWQAGDTYAALAERFYGSPAQASVLARYNQSEASVTPGQRIFVPVTAGAASPQAPTDASAATSGGAAAAGRFHVVAKGETLWKIAQQELGNGARWQEIYAANREQLPRGADSLKVGMRLKLP